MKRTSLIVAALLLAFSGCSCGQGWSGWRPNILGRMHDRIHGTNVGAPCMSGNCASAPAMAGLSVADTGCESCGSGVQNMSYDGNSNSSSYGGREVIGSTYGGMQSFPTQETIVAQPAR